MCQHIESVISAVTYAQRTHSDPVILHIYVRLVGDNHPDVFKQIYAKQIANVMQNEICSMSHSVIQNPAGE